MHKGLLIQFTAEIIFYIYHELQHLPHALLHQTIRSSFYDKFFPLIPVGTSFKNIIFLQKSL